MSAEIKFPNQIVTAERELRESMDRFSIGSKNLLSHFLGSAEKALKAYSEHQAILMKFIIQSQTEGSKDRFRNILMNFETFVSDSATQMEKVLADTERATRDKLKYVGEILEESHQDPTRAHELMQGLSEEKRDERWNCRMDRMGSVEQFVRCLDQQKKYDLPNAKRRFGEDPIEQRPGDSVPEDQSIVHFYDVNPRHMEHIEPSERFRRKSIG